MMKRVLTYAVMAASLMAIPTTISARQTYDTGYDVYYYGAGDRHFSNLVGVRRAICDPYDPIGGVVTYMEWGVQSANDEWVEVVQCPID